MPGLLIIQVRLKYLERELKYFPPLTKKRREKTGECFNTRGREEQGLNCKSLEQGIELCWPLTVKEIDTGRYWWILGIREESGKQPFPSTWNWNCLKLQSKCLPGKAVVRCTCRLLHVDKQE